MELLITILVVGILIAVAAPSFLGQTQKAHDSASKQYLTIAYHAAAAYATDGSNGTSGIAPGWGGQGSFSGFDGDILHSIEPELTGEVVAGGCPLSATRDPKHITIALASGGDLTLCNDPDHTVWTLRVVSHVLLGFTSAVVPEPGNSDSLVLSSPTALVVGSSFGPLSFSPDSQRLLAHSADGILNFVTLANGDTLPIDHPQNASNYYGLAAWAPDSQHLLGRSDANGAFGMFAVANGNFTPTFSTAVIAQGDAAISQDGTKFVYNLQEGGGSALFSNDLNGGDQVRLSPLAESNGDQAFQPQISPSGNSVAYAAFYAGVDDGQPHVYVVPIAGGSSVDLGRGQAPSWSPDGQRVAFVRLLAPGNQIVSDSAGGGDLVQVTDAPYGVTGASAEPVWSSDGLLIAYVAYNVADTSAASLYVVSSSGGSARELVSGTRHARVSSVAWSPDGTKIAYDLQGEAGDPFGVYYLRVS